PSIRWQINVRPDSGVMTRRGQTAACDSTRGGRAYARAALAGNPSDGFGGATLAVTVPDYCAEVEVSPADCDAVEPGSPLVAAALRRFVRETGNGVAKHLRWRTSIPREVGLGGSSAIVIAALRALCAMHELDIAPGTLAELALAVEVEELGIHAGPQDRFAQAHEGLTFMDFAGDPPSVERLDTALLPP